MAAAHPAVKLLAVSDLDGRVARVARSPVARPSCPMATMYDARQTLEITLAIEESARSGQSVRLAC